MYRDAYQRGMLTIFFSGGSNPLAIWETFIQSGYINRFLDQEIKSMVLEIGGSNISTTYIVCPKGNQVLGIHMPFMIMIVKNLMKYFSFEVTILDETRTRRRFRVSNFQSKTQILPLCTVMPIGLTPGWNQIQFNLAEFTRRAYQKQYVEVQKVKINANIRLRRIYFAERLMSDEELPPEYKLYFPLDSKHGKAKKVIAENLPVTLEKKKSKLDVEKQNLSKKSIPIMPNAEQGELPLKEEKTAVKEDVTPAGETTGAKEASQSAAIEEKQLSAEKTLSADKIAREDTEPNKEQPSQVIQESPSIVNQPVAEEPVVDDKATNENVTEQPHENAVPAE